MSLGAIAAKDLRLIARDRPALLFLVLVPVVVVVIVAGALGGEGSGHILLPGGSDFVNVNGVDDKLTHDFHSGPLKTIRDLRVEFFYMSHGRLIPYDFRNQDHVLTFEVSCSTDKLENLTPLELPSSPEKKAVNIPVEKKRNLYDFEFKTEYLYIMLIVFTGLTLVLTMGKRRA